MPVEEIFQQQKLEGMDVLASEGMLRLWLHRHQTDGFYAAVWERSTD